jgi:glyoxylase-like metal-dependent hydrolase (beta-lactamase superfamily II)/ferredoxin
MRSGIGCQPPRTHIGGMASVKKRLAANAAGDFFVDSSCIDCGTCRWMAPEVFSGDGEHSFVQRQPEGEDHERLALMALMACPTGSIGTARRHDLAPIREAFPREIDGQVLHCGFHAENSFGAASWLIRRAHGNVMVDCPRFTSPLVRRLEDMGGIAAMVLTHCDDVADHRRYASHFGCRRILHAADQDSSTADVEILISGRAPVQLDADLVLIPVPGHTRGSMCLLHRDCHLFTGDHLAWDRRRARLAAFRDVCWYDWGELVASMERLATFRFEWVLPGHGAPCHLPAQKMADRMAELLGRLHAD